MKIKILSLILMIFIGISAFAQTTPTAVITGNAVSVIGPGGTIYPVSLQIQLTGCGAQVPLVPGGSVVTNFYKQSAPGPSYSATITAYGNDVITCGTQSYTTYAATWLINNQPAAPTATYRLVQGQTCNISDGSCKPIGFVPPVISKGAGLFCPVGQSLQGFNADYTPTCIGFTASALPSFRTNNITNSDQTVLNLIATGGITATATGGNITLNGSGLVMKFPSVSQMITQAINTDLAVTTSGSGRLLYNGNEVLTAISAGSFFVTKNPTTTQTITQPVNTSLNVTTSGSGIFASNGSTVLTVANGCGLLNCVSKSPTADQTITQPAGTTLHLNSFDNILYADQCPPTSGGLGDIGDRINSCRDLLPNSSGYKVGTIILPNTAGSAFVNWTTPVHLGPGVNLRGQGLLASTFNCTVAICLQGDASGNAGGQFAHTVGVSQVWQDFTIVGTAGPTVTQTIIELLDEQNLTLMNVATDGANSPLGTCIQLHDVNWWTERNTFINVSTLYNCTTGWRLIADGGNPFQPLPSFGYNRLIDVKGNINDGQAHAGQTWMSIEGNSYFYNSTIRATVNTDLAAAQPPNSTMIHMQNSSKFYQNELHLFGEGQSKWVLDIGATNQFVYIGQIDVAPQTNNFVAGAVITHFMDDGGFGPILPSVFFSPVAATAGIFNTLGLQVTSMNSCTIAAGSTLTSCNNTQAIAGQPNTSYSVLGCTVDTATGGTMLAGSARTKTTTSFVVPVYSADTATTGGGMLRCLVIRSQ